MTKRWFDVPMLFQANEGGQAGAAGGTGNGNSAGQNAGQSQGQQQQQQEQPKFTQADVDRLLGDRAKRAEEATQTRILEALGVKSLDDLKKIKEDADKLREAQLSELDKARKDAAEAQAKIEKAEKERTEALAQATEMLMKSAVLAEATKADYRIRSEAMPDVWSFIKADKALLEKIKAKDGEPGEFTGVAEAIKELLKVKTYMVGAGDGQGTPRQSRRLAQQGRKPSEDELARASRIATHNKF